MDEKTEGQGVIPGDGPGAGYVRKGWIQGLCLGFFLLILALLGLLYWEWPRCTSTSAPLKPLTITPTGQGTPSPADKLQITSVSPGSGSSTGGERVQISGTGFTNKGLVKFDQMPATALYVNPKIILATPPAHGEGAVDVSVQDESGNISVLPRGFTYQVCPGEETILLLVLIAGALGGTLHSARSLSWYVGNRDFKWSWVPTYALRPITGAALACIFFLCISGGVVNSQNPSNRLWIVGLAALIGLFSQQGFEKLKKIFEAIFTPVPPGADKPKPAGPVLTIAPATGPRDGGNVVKITGTGFLAATTVRFGATPATAVQFDSPTALSVTVPPAQAAGAVDVVVTVPGGQPAILAGGYIYM
jgi:hypothetical protein